VICYCGFVVCFEFDPAEGTGSHTLIDTGSQVIGTEFPILNVSQVLRREMYF